MEMREKLLQKIADLEKDVIDLKDELVKQKYEYERRLSEQQIQDIAKISNLEGKLEEKVGVTDRLFSVVEKASLKTTNSKTITNTNNSTNTTNNIVNYISNDAIDFTNLNENMKKTIGAKEALKSQESFSEDVRLSLLQDMQGKSKIMCTDLSRGNFVYKGESGQDFVYDPMLVTLRQKLRQGVDKKHIIKELEKVLDNKYDRGTTEWIMEYRRAMKNLEFPDNFAKHVAKKTYRRAMINFLD